MMNAEHDVGKMKSRIYLRHCKTLQMTLTQTGRLVFCALLLETSTSVPTAIVSPGFKLLFNFMFLFFVSPLHSAECRLVYLFVGVIFFFVRLTS